MTTLERYGLADAQRAVLGMLAEGETLARVTSAHGDYFHLMCNEAEGEILARKKSACFRAADVLMPVTGDFVAFNYNPTGESRITRVVGRFSTLERVDPASKGFRTQTLAVNFDTLFFLMSANANFSLARLERMLALCAQSKCRARLVVLLTKTDLVDAAVCADLLQQIAAYDVPVHAISVRTGAGMAGLSPWVQMGRTLALVGSSGVGKSSLVNKLAGEDWMATQEIQEWSDKGRHTTTSRELVLLPSGVLALDTPGMRELGVPGKDGDSRFRSSGTHRYRTSS